MNARENKRLSREDWENAAIDAIAAGGLGAVAVEPLAASLGVTKGSFYAHFGSRRELVDAALARWEMSHSASLADLSTIEDPAKRLEMALASAIAFSQSGQPSAHLRLLGEMSDPVVRGAVARVDAARIARLAASYRAAGFGAKRAERRARLAYATYVGLLVLAQDDPEKRLDANGIAKLVRELRDPLLAPAQPRSQRGEH
jgi:AcrR family transcriptional regulator